MHSHARSRRATCSTAAALALVVAACAATGTPGPPSSEAGASSTQIATPTASASGEVVAGSGQASGAPSAGVASSGPPAGASSAAPSSAPASVAPLPAPGTAHVYGCASLLSGQQVSSATRIPSILFVPPGILPKLPKGETECKYVGEKRVTAKTFDILTTDVYVLTDGARAPFDTEWNQNRDSSMVVTVDGVGDDAAWSAQGLSLFGIKGATAFEITLEPSPLTIFSPAVARATATALARIVVAHL